MVGDLQACMARVMDAWMIEVLLHPFINSELHIFQAQPRT